MDERTHYKVIFIDDEKIYKILVYRKWWFLFSGRNHIKFSDRDISIFALTNKFGENFAVNCESILSNLFKEGILLELKEIDRT